jgi:hypothetical protein
VAVAVLTAAVVIGAAPPRRPWRSSSLSIPAVASFTQKRRRLPFALSLAAVLV